MKYRGKTKSRSGVGLVEVVVGAALILVIFSGLFTVFNFYIKKSLSLTDNIKAEFLTQEGVEAVRTIRDGSFATLSSLLRNTNYYLYWNGSAWVSTTTSELIDSVFARQFVLQDVYRDGSGNIASSGTLDSSILRADVSVLWLENGTTTTRTLSTYLGDIF